MQKGPQQLTKEVKNMTVANGTNPGGKLNIGVLLQFWGPKSAFVHEDPAAKLNNAIWVKKVKIS